MNKTEWYEVWADESPTIPYLLLVRGQPGRLEIEVHDPCENNQIVFTASDYETVRLWLLEDEYTLIEGRRTRGGD